MSVSDDPVQRSQVRRPPPPARPLQVLAVLVYAAVLASPRAPAPEQLVAEGRAGHVRELDECGMTRACVKRPAVPRPSAATLFEIIGRPVPMRSRWSAEQYDTLRVWIAPAVAPHRWTEASRIAVRDAFHDWTSAGAPVRFAFTPDSSHADVHVLWRERLADGRAGQMTRMADHRGWLRAATIELSTRGLTGRRQRVSTVHAVALHEVGHLLGLEHSGDDRDIMAAWVTAPSLTRRDVEAMRVLYDVADTIAVAPGASLGGRPAWIHAGLPLLAGVDSAGRACQTGALMSAHQLLVPRATSFHRPPTNCMTTR